MDVRAKWERLSADDKERLLQDHCDRLDWDWWESVYESFREEMEALGIRTNRIFFSGFWCQGDGACFEGYVTDWSKFLPACGLAELMDAAKLTHISLEWSHFGRYYHEHSVSFSDQLWVDNPFDEEQDPLRHSAWEALYPGAGGPFVDELDHMIEFIRGQMRRLYRSLEAEYEHLTSEETTLEYILANHPEEIDDLLDRQDEERAADAQQSFIF